MLKKLFFNLINNFHALFFSIIPVLFLYSQNINEVKFSETVRFLTISFLCVLFLTALLSFLIPKSKKGYGILSVFLLFFYFFGYADSFVFGYFDDGETPFGALLLKMLPLLWILTAAVFSMIIIKMKKRRFLKLNRFLNVFACAWLIIIILNILYFNAAALFEKEDTADILSDIQISEMPENLPNIYLIIFDAYPRKDILTDVFAYDNSEIINYLNSKRFFVAEESRSNYRGTLNSVLSIFSMNYLKEYNVVDFRRFLELFKRTLLYNLLKDSNYSIISFSTNIVWSSADYADYVFLTDLDMKVNFFEVTLINNTFISLFLKNEIFEKHYKKIQKQMEVLSTEKNLRKMQKKSPYFFYAHIDMPHPPFVFNERGNFNIKEQRVFTYADDHFIVGEFISAEKYRELFVEQLKFINKKIKEIVDNLLEKDENSIIIIMGDHGSRSIIDKEHPLYLEEKYANFFSVYLPDKNAGELFYDTITPVNVFRIILKEYFFADIDKIKDEIF